MTTVSFVAETTGLCDVFSIKLDSVNSGGTLVTLLKSRNAYCTRPEHESRFEVKEIGVGQLQSGPYYLANPVTTTSVSTGSILAIVVPTQSRARRSFTLR